MPDTFSFDELEAALETTYAPANSGKPARRRVNRGAQRKRKAAKDAQRADSDKSLSTAMESRGTEALSNPWSPRFDTFLVLDVEATCVRDTPGGSKKSRFEYPNEIIDFPVILMEWAPLGDRPDSLPNNRLHEVATFHRFVRPTWRPQLSTFCRSLTSVSQEQVDESNTWSEVVSDFVNFLKSHDLLVESSHEAGVGAYEQLSLRHNVTWVTHGPCDLDDFVQKQFYISYHLRGEPTPGHPPVLRVPEYPPPFFRRPMLDIRMATAAWAEHADRERRKNAVSSFPDLRKEELELKLNELSLPVSLLAEPNANFPSSSGASTRRRLADGTLAGCLAAFGLTFEGTEHTGLDDAQNVARVVNALLGVVEVAWLQLQLKDASLSANIQSALDVRDALGAEGSEQPDSSNAASRPSLAEIIRDTLKLVDFQDQLTEWDAAIASTRRLERQCLLPFRRERAGPRRRWSWMQHGIIDYQREFDDGAVYACQSGGRVHHTSTAALPTHTHESTIHYRNLDESTTEGVEAEAQHRAGKVSWIRAPYSPRRVSPAESLQFSASRRCIMATRTTPSPQPPRTVRSSTSASRLRPLKLADKASVPSPSASPLPTELPPSETRSRPASPRFQLFRKKSRSSVKSAASSKQGATAVKTSLDSEALQPSVRATEDSSSGSPRSQRNGVGGSSLLRKAQGFKHKPAAASLQIKDEFPPLNSTLTNSTISSSHNGHAHSLGGRLSPLPPHMGIPSQRKVGQNEEALASESWLVPEDAEGAHVRKTYAHFEAKGVPGDGFVEGREYTRERRGKEAWEENDVTVDQDVENWGREGEWKNRTLRHDRAASCSRPSSAYLTPPEPPMVDPESSAQASTSASLHAGIGRASSSASASQQKSDAEILSTPTTAVFADPPLASGKPVPARSATASPEATFLVPPPAPPSAASHASINSDVTEGEVKLSETEWQRRIEMADQKREELLARVDRYGFFSHRNEASSHGRVVIVPASAYDDVPTRGPSKADLRSAKALTLAAAADEAGPSTFSNSRPTTIHHPEDTAKSLATRITALRTKRDELSRRREGPRTAKWAKMLSVVARDEGGNVAGYGIRTGNEKYVARRVYKGIPDAWRSAAWWAFVQQWEAPSATTAQKGKTSKVSIRRTSRNGTQSASGVARLRLRSLAADEARYARLLPRPSPHDVQIDLDVPRTISGHIAFHTRYGQGQRALFHVLHAFSLLCPSCGYCQGMGPIAATLLCYFPPERAYAILVRMHGPVLPDAEALVSNGRPASPAEEKREHIRFRDAEPRSLGLHAIFSPGFPGVVENFYVQEQLLKYVAPSLAALLAAQGVHTSSYATRWYITLFANAVPFSTQLRLWDAIMLPDAGREGVWAGRDGEGGQDAMVIFAVGLLWGMRKDLGADPAKGPSASMAAGFEKSLEKLSSFVVPEDDDGLMEWVKRVGSRRSVRQLMRKSRQDWRQLVSTGEAASWVL